MLTPDPFVGRVRLLGRRDDIGLLESIRRVEVVAVHFCDGRLGDLAAAEGDRSCPIGRRMAIENTQANAYTAIAVFNANGDHVDVSWRRVHGLNEGWVRWPIVRVGHGWGREEVPVLHVL